MSKIKEFCTRCQIEHLPGEHPTAAEPRPFQEGYRVERVGLPLMVPLGKKGTVDRVDDDRVVVSWDQKPPLTGKDLVSYNVDTVHKYLRLLPHAPAPAPGPLAPLDPVAEKLLKDATKSLAAANAELEEARKARQRILACLGRNPLPETWGDAVRIAEMVLKNVHKHRTALGLDPNPNTGGTIGDGIQRLKDELAEAIKERDEAREIADRFDRFLARMEEIFPEADARPELLGCAMQAIKDRDEARREGHALNATVDNLTDKLDDIRALHRAIDLTAAEGDGWHMLHQAMGEVLAR